MKTKEKIITDHIHCPYLQYSDRYGDRSLSILKDDRTSTGDKVLSWFSECTFYLGQIL